MAGVGVYSYAKTHYPPQSSVGKDGSIVELGTVTSVIRSKSQNSFFEQQEIKLNNALGAGRNANTKHNNIESQKFEKRQFLYKNSEYYDRFVLSWHIPITSQIGSCVFYVKMKEEILRI